MAIEVYWGSGSSYSWRVLLALEFKRLKYVSHELDLSKLEHKSEQMLKLNHRGRVPVIKEGDYVCYESLAILTYLERKHPKPPLFGRTSQEAGTIMRILCEYQGYVEEPLTKIVTAVFFQGFENRLEEINKAVDTVATEARTLEARLTQHAWLGGDACSAADIMIFPGIKLLQRALGRPEAQDLRTPFAPLENNFPAIARWLLRVEALPGYERTYPPHWRE